MDLDKIAKREKVTKGTIVDRMCKQIASGELDILQKGIVTSEEWLRTCSLIDTGNTSLKKLHQTTGIEYPKLQLMKAKHDSLSREPHAWFKWEQAPNRTFSLCVEDGLRTKHVHSGLPIIRLWSKGVFECECPDTQKVGLVCQHKGAEFISRCVGPVQGLWGKLGVEREAWQEIVRYDPFFNEEGAIMCSYDSAIDWYESSSLNYFTELLHQIYFPCPAIFWHRHRMEGVIFPSPKKLSKFKRVAPPTLSRYKGFFIFRQPSGDWSAVNRLSPVWNRIVKKDYNQLSRLIDYWAK